MSTGGTDRKGGNGNGLARMAENIEYDGDVRSALGSPIKKQASTVFLAKPVDETWTERERRALGLGEGGRNGNHRRRGDALKSITNSLCKQRPIDHSFDTSKNFHTRTLLCTAPEGERNLQIFRGVNARPALHARILVFLVSQVSPKNCASFFNSTFELGDNLGERRDAFCFDKSTSDACPWPPRK